MDASIMLGNRRLVVDEWAEVYDLLSPYADETFWQWSDVEFDPDAIYVVGRLIVKENWQSLRNLCAQYPRTIVFCNPAEGSETIKLQLRRLRITDLVQSRKMLLLTSGDLEPGFGHLSTDGYFTNICEYTENLQAAEFAHEVYTAPKPYDFLFLNGRLRPHRHYLINRLQTLGLLDRALWTCLQTQVDMPWSSHLDLSGFGDRVELRLLPAQYEIERAVKNLDAPMPKSDVKHFLFNNTWGDAIVNPRCYIDTAFSIVAETIYDYPYSFRTEKIWKPMIMAHPWIAVANPGYYRDLRNLGFRTFDHLIDETFDLVDNPQDRLERIVEVIADIVRNGSSAFLMAAQEVCKYNQQHLREHNRQERSQLPQNLARYING
jgi:hypothetical protein